ncbi:hypothetical protein ABT304_17260 [Nocardioides sp. NPDC000445]|uniref:hypothetical protein n=1 Tax=Nocardioides sp. NPDC000445 TaxID=3154257 RepID=UPI00331652AA
MTGELSVQSIGDEVTGNGAVKTERLPAADKVKHKLTKTGEKVIFGLMDKRQLSAVGYVVDPIFEQMIDDYYVAYARFHDLLQKRHADTDA